MFGCVLGEHEQSYLEVGDLTGDLGGVEAAAEGDEFCILGQGEQQVQRVFVVAHRAGEHPAGGGRCHATTRSPP